MRALKKNKIGWRDVVVFLGLVVFSHVMTYELFDAFHDGVVYHQPAINRIAEGFNPVYDGYMYIGRPADVWSDHATYFPKAAWYFAASITDALGDIQTGKAYTALLLFASVFFALYCTKGEHILKRLLWIMACLNPLTLTQLAAYVSDGALASLCVMSLLYARFFFNGKWPPDKLESRLVHVIGMLSLVFVFCIKTSGVAYSCIIVFCICLHRMSRVFGASDGAKNTRLWKGFKNAFALGLKLGGAMILLSAVLACAPYVTDALKGHHMFHSMYSKDLAKFAVPDGFERILSTLYPSAGNRFSRLLLSIITYPTSNRESPAVLKTPFGAPMLEWRQFAVIGNMASATFGPFFYLLCILALVYSGAFYIYVKIQKRGEFQFEGWLLFTIAFMTAIQPHSWQTRYAPFVWFLPVVLFLSAPKKKEYLLSIPLLIFFINIAGIMYFFVPNYIEVTKRIHAELEPHRGQTVLLDKSTSQMDGIFARFGIKQKFANPEAVVFSNKHWLAFHPERQTGRLAFGSSIAFSEDIPPVPAQPLDLSSETAKPYIVMSEGIMLLDTEDNDDIIKKMLVQFYKIPETGLWNYSSRVKFYMRVLDEPAGDMELSITAATRTMDGEIRTRILGDAVSSDITTDANRETQTLAASKMKVYAGERLLGEWTWDTLGSSEKAVVIPREVLEDSYNDDLRLLTLRFDISDADKASANSIYRLRFEGIRLTLKAGLS
ncbi:hypothetical protein AGMMS50276_09540 [Synergistales bacterium]|nr:hypothetical protein AGMMS50276_09540 [Synergistales bacterium]